MKGYVEGAQLRDCVLSLTLVVLFIFSDRTTGAGIFREPC